MFWINFICLGLISFLPQIIEADTFSADKRTDGPAGSEYADFSSIEGDLQMGAQFGAVLPVSDNADSSFALGLDADYRPYDLFGLRFTYLQGLKSPRLSLLSLTPLVHSQFSNLKPYAYFGPGIAITNVGGTEGKFLMAAGVGADVQVVDHFSIGLLWTYDIIIDSFDAHSLSARLGFQF